MQRWRLFYIGLFFCLLLPLSVTADVVKLKDGGQLEGDVIREGDAYRIILRPGVEVTISADQVAEVIETPSVREMARKRQQALLPYDADGHFELGVWCRTRKLTDLAEDLFRAAIRIEPDHEKAREALGYRRLNGEWVPFETYQKAQGLVRHGTRWVTPEKKARLEFEAREKEYRDRIQRLIREIRTYSPESAAKARKKLLAIKAPEAGKPLLGLLDHHAEEIRALAAITCRPYMNESVARRLTLLVLDDHDKEVRKQALASLATTRYESIADFLLHEYLFSPYGKIRDRAARTLGRLRYRRAIGPFIETLTEKVSRRRLRPLVRGLVRRRGVRVSPTYGLGLQTIQRVTDYKFNAAAHDALVIMTGKDFHYDQARWRKWWAENEERFGIFLDEVETETDTESR